MILVLQNKNKEFQNNRLELQLLKILIKPYKLPNKTIIDKLQLSKKTNKLLSKIQMLEDLIKISNNTTIMPVKVKAKVVVEVVKELLKEFN